MSHGLVVLDAESLEVAASLAAATGASRIHLLDPAAMDRAHATGLDLVVDPPRQGPDYAGLTAWAHQQAVAIEQTLEAAFVQLFPGRRFLGWQHLNFYYLLLKLRWYEHAAGEWAARWPGGTAHVLVNDNPAHYYWPSFLAGQQLVQRGAAHRLAVEVHHHGARPDASALVPDLRGAIHRGYELLTHLPTCFHDAEHFASELTAAGRSAVNLRARHWDVDLPAHQHIGLVPVPVLAAEVADEDHRRIQAFCGFLQQVVLQVLRPYVASPELCQRQAAFIARLVQGQLIVSLRLDVHFANRCPDRLLISEHDAGFHGPLLDWSERVGIPVVMVPHSKTSTDLEFPQRNVRILTHPLQSTAPFDARRRRVPHAAFCYPEAQSRQTPVPEPLRTVGLVLNGLTLGGVLCTPYADYAEALRRIAAFCRDRKLTLRVRSRPGQLMTELLQQTTGLSVAELADGMSKPLHAFAREVDLGLMLDAPTNGGIEFLRQGVPLVNAAIDTLSRSEAFTCNASVVPRQDLEATLMLVADLADDTVELQQFASRQFAAYTSLFAGTLPLRAHL